MSPFKRTLGVKFVQSVWLVQVSDTATSHRQFHILITGCSLPVAGSRPETVYIRSGHQWLTAFSSDGRHLVDLCWTLDGNKDESPK